MNDQRIAILTDTGTNVPADFAAAHDVRQVALAINYSDGTFRSGVDITTDEVIDRFAQEIPTTSLPSPDDIQKALDAAQADGYERAVFVTISSGLSATNSTVELVASHMENFPVEVVDTKSIGVAAGMVVMAAVRMVEEGVPFEHLKGKLEEVSADTRVYFTVKDLMYLRHGGRINEATYRLGSMLNLKPYRGAVPQAVPPSAFAMTLWRRPPQATAFSAQTETPFLQHGLYLSGNVLAQAKQPPSR